MADSIDDFSVGMVVETFRRDQGTVESIDRDANTIHVAMFTGETKPFDPEELTPKETMG